MKPSWSLLALLCCAAPGAAQTRPLVEVVPAAKAAPRPHLAPQRVGVGDCYEVPGAELEELAFIRVTLSGPWERTAEHLAKEKAGELGANCLLPAGGGGTDNMRGPAQRAYKAYRVTVPMGPYQVPAAPESLPALPAAGPGAGNFQTAGFRQLTPPAEHSAHLGWLGSAATVEHLLAIDPATAGAELWDDILKDAEEYFPAAETARLRAAGESRTAAGLDLVNLSVTVPGKEPLPATVLRGAPR